MQQKLNGLSCITIELKLYNLFIIISCIILFIFPLRINGQSVINEGDLYYIKKIKYINSQVALIEARLQNERYLILTTHEFINNKGIRRKCYYTFDLINIYPDYKLNDTISITNLADIYSLQIIDNICIVHNKNYFKKQRYDTITYYIKPKKKYNYNLFKLGL